YTGASLAPPVPRAIPISDRDTPPPPSPAVPRGVVGDPTAVLSRRAIMDLIYWSAPGKPCGDKSRVTTDKKVALETLQWVLDETKGHLYKIGFAGNPQARRYGHEGVESIDRKWATWCISRCRGASGRRCTSSISHGAPSRSGGPRRNSSGSRPTSMGAALSKTRGR